MPNAELALGIEDVRVESDVRVGHPVAAHSSVLEQGEGAIDVVV